MLQAIAPRGAFIFDRIILSYIHIGSISLCYCPVWTNLMYYDWQGLDLILPVWKQRFWSLRGSNTRWLFERNPLEAMALILVECSKIDRSTFDPSPESLGKSLFMPRFFIGSSKCTLTFPDLNSWVLVTKATCIYLYIQVFKFCTRKSTDFFLQPNAIPLTFRRSAHWLLSAVSGFHAGIDFLRPHWPLTL